MVTRNEAPLWNIHKLKLLEQRYRDRSLFPGFTIDMSMFFSMYLELAVPF